MNPCELSANAVVFLERNSIRHNMATPLVATSDKLFLVTTSDSQYILKCKRGRSSFARLFRDSLPSFGFDQEIRIYRRLVEKHAKHGFKFPNLIAADRSHLLIEYVPSNAPTESGPVKPRWIADKVAIALNRFTTSDVTNEQRGLSSVIHRMLFSPEAVIARKLRTVWRNQMGYGAYKKGIALLAKCRKLQPPLRRKYWSHNDFSANNVVVNHVEKEVYFIDFQDVTFENRWVLMDAIRYCSSFPMAMPHDGFDDFIDVSFIASYVSHWERNLHTCINFPVQVRLACLNHVLRSMEYRLSLPNADVTANGKFINDFLINDDGFSRWYLSFANKLKDARNSINHPFSLA